MPAPDSGDQGVFPKEQAEKYWQKCVMEYAGYFNVLVCKPPGKNFTAVLGLMAMNPDVCYPLHAHVATEVYWQVGGQGVWRTWKECSNATRLEQGLGIVPPDGECLMSGPEKSWSNASEFGSKYSTAWHQKNATGHWEYKDQMSPHWHPSPVVHEMDTTASTAADSTHLLNFYLWAKPDEEKNQYHTGLGYFDMHKVFEKLNGSNAIREDRARELIGTCATKEQIPSIFHAAWQPNLRRWLPSLTDWTPPNVTCPARRERR